MVDIKAQDRDANRPTARPQGKAEATPGEEHADHKGTALNGARESTEGLTQTLFDAFQRRSASRGPDSYGVAGPRGMTLRPPLSRHG